MCKDSEKSSKAQKGSKDLSKEGNKLVFCLFLFKWGWDWD